CGHHQLEDLLPREAVEMHDQGAQRVAMRRDENALAGLHVRQDVRLPVRYDARRGVGEALAPGWLDVVAAAPLFDLRVAPLLRRLGFVEALQIAIHTLVERRVAFRSGGIDAGRGEGEGCPVDGPLE